MTRTGIQLVAAAESFSYDAENHLASMDGGTVSIVYDAFGNRVSQTVGGTMTQYLVEDDVNPTGLPQVFDELTNGAVSRTHTYGLQHIDEDQIVGGSWIQSFYGYDGGGSVRQLTNLSGAVTDTYNYDAFGMLRDIMIDNNQSSGEFSDPGELHQQLPRTVRPAARGIYYLLGSLLMSTAIATLVIVVGSLTPREIRDRTDLNREGKVAYTDDVRVGGGRSATVFYTFAYDGKSYGGDSFLPHQYLGMVNSYSKNGKFPILFLPRNPSVNHPYDWTGSGSFPVFLYIFVAIIVIQWGETGDSIHIHLLFWSQQC